ncbi:hypothetical protein ABZ871_01160 [Streptomyces populi]|uniref:hypothetical protein n=1 Tax=Streptomyces sp. AHU1 TaxID=3377215 RepID=UPI003482726D
MRKFQQVVIAAVAAGGLSAIGVGTATAAPENGPKASDIFRPYQECSPQTVLENDIPISVLGLSRTLDTTCGQHNTAFTH